MTYTIGEMAKLLGLTASTLRYYDKEGLLPFVERSESGIRIFKDEDISWFNVIDCMKKAGMSIKDIRDYTEMTLQNDDDTIDARLAMFHRQQAILQQQMEELKQSMEMVNYKCWYYELAKEKGSVKEPLEMDISEVPKEYRAIRQKLRNIPESVL